MAKGCDRLLQGEINNSWDSLKYRTGSFMREVNKGYHGCVDHLGTTMVKSRILIWLPTLKRFKNSNVCFGFLLVNSRIKFS